MLALYVFTLVVGGGLLGISLLGDLLGGDAEGIGDAPSADIASGTDAGKILSLRNLTYALFGFGATGSLLAWRAPGAPLVGLAAALCVGIGVGLLARFVFNKLNASESGETGGAEAENRLLVRQAELRREAETADKVARVAAERAEVEAERELQKQRVETERQRLNAEVITPAEAERVAAEARARAAAAPIIANGQAQAEVLELLYKTIEDGGEQGFAVFMAEKLPALLGMTVDAVKGIEIDRLVVVDSDGSSGVGNAASQRVTAAFRLIEQLGGALGVDVERALRGLGNKLATPVPAGGAPITRPEP